MFLKALSHRRDAITRCVNAIKGKLEPNIYLNDSFTLHATQRCGRIIKIYKVIIFIVNRIDASRYRIASV